MSLLTLRPEQLEALAADARRQLELAQARRLVAEKRVGDEETAIALVQAALPRAGALRLVAEGDLAAFLDLCAKHGVGFEDRHAGARAALENPELPGWMRLRRAAEALGD